MSISAMKQALEVLEAQHNWAVANTGAFTKQSLNAITILRQAIAEAEKQEPFGIFQYDMRIDAWVQNRNSDKGVAFYTHPQPKREWVGLTDEEWVKELGSVREQLDGDVFGSFYRAIEAKLKEKNT